MIKVIVLISKYNKGVFYVERNILSTIDTLIKWKSIYSLIGYTDDLEIISNTIDILKNYNRAIEKKKNEEGA